MMPRCQVLHILGIVARCILARTGSGEPPYPRATELVPIWGDAQVILRTLDGSPSVPSFLNLFSDPTGFHRPGPEYVSQLLGRLVSRFGFGTRTLQFGAVLRRQGVVGRHSDGIMLPNDCQRLPADGEDQSIALGGQIIVALWEGSNPRL